MSHVTAVAASAKAARAMTAEAAAEQPRAPFPPQRPCVREKEGHRRRPQVGGRSGKVRRGDRRARSASAKARSCRKRVLGESGPSHGASRQVRRHPPQRVALLVQGVAAKTGARTNTAHCPEQVAGRRRLARATPFPPAPVRTGWRVFCVWPRRQREATVFSENACPASECAQLVLRGPGARRRTRRRGGHGDPVMPALFALAQPCRPRRQRFFARGSFRRVLKDIYIFLRPGRARAFFRFPRTSRKVEVLGPWKTSAGPPLGRACAFAQASLEITKIEVAKGLNLGLSWIYLTYIGAKSRFSALKSTAGSLEAFPTYLPWASFFEAYPCRAAPAGLTPS